MPDWIGNFQNPDWPELFAEYAAAFAKRFPWVRFYTPVNEIFVAATFSAQYGWWNERLASDRAFVTALKHLCQANVLAMQAILRSSPTPSSSRANPREYFHPDEPDCAATRATSTTRSDSSRSTSRTATTSTSTMYEYLLDNGMTRDEYHWFRAATTSRPRCIMGNDYYVTNEHLVHADGSISPSGEIFGYYVITHQYYDRYRLPVMHTETN